MKKAIAFVLLFWAQFMVAQQEGATLLANDNHIYDYKNLQVRPEFPGGMQKFDAFFNANFRIPQGLDKNIKPQLILMFVVEKDGSLTDIKVLRDFGSGSGAEAVRLLKAAPRWLPGEQNGHKVRARYYLPIIIEALVPHKK